MSFWGVLNTCVTSPESCIGMLSHVGMSYVVSPQGSTHSREDLCSKSGAGMEILLRPENSKYKYMQL